MYGGLKINEQIIEKYILKKKEKKKGATKGPVHKYLWTCTQQKSWGVYGHTAIILPSYP